MKISILNGPNLNLLGTREPSIYGHQTLSDIEAMVAAHASGPEIEFFQTTRAGELVDAIQGATREADALTLNAAAYTHTSIAIHDSLKAASLPKVEVHLSNPAAREAFRHHSYVSPVVDVVIAGAGPVGYCLAVDAVLALAERRAAATENA